MRTEKILTGALGVIIIAAIVVGLLFAFGVINLSKTKLPIVYPDKNINWVSNEDKTMVRGSFDSALDISGEEFEIVFDINNLELGYNDDNLGMNARLSLVENNNVAYDIYVFSSGNFYYEDENSTSIECQISIKLYNNATLTAQGDITSGKGFVIEVSNFGMDLDQTGEFTPQEIESFKVYSIYEYADNVQLIK